MFIKVYLEINTNINIVHFMPLITEQVTMSIVTQQVRKQKQE